MSGLQPGLAPNEKQAGRPQPAPRAVWAGLLGRASVEDTLAVPGGPPTSMGGLGDWPASSGQCLHRGRAALPGCGRALLWRQTEPALALSGLPSHSVTLGTVWFIKPPLKIAMTPSRVVG